MPKDTVTYTLNLDEASLLLATLGSQIMLEKEFGEPSDPELCALGKRLTDEMQEQLGLEAPPEALMKLWDVAR